MALRSKLKQAAGGRPRAPRVPLWLRISTRPELGECWSLNVSTGGMAISVAVASGASVSEGEALELEFALPETQTPVRALGRVVWVDGGRRGGNGQFALGVSFEQMTASDAAALERFLADYRPRVVLVTPQPSEEGTCREALEPDVFVHVAHSPGELHEALARGDVHAAVLFADEEGVARAFAQQISGASPLWQAGTVAAPRVVLCARLKAERLLALEGEGRFFQTLRRPAEPAALRFSVRRACEDYALREELRRSHLELERAYRRLSGEPSAAAVELPSVSEIVFEGPQMRRVLELVRTVSPHKAHVLVQGETGTGKELVARAIHALSPRANRAFVALDCGALPETLLESELFGHVQGAFTGAVSDRPGLFQLADGGTLFLDEIENTTPALQAKLLRVIDTGELRPVGGSQVRKVDVRLVAASNRDLKAEADRERFRADLFYRLSTFPVDLPPLRERTGDVVKLSRFFARRHAKAMGRPEVPLTEEAERVLAAYHWPGNVRELRNALERAVLLTPPGMPIDASVLPPAMRKQASAPVTRGNSLRDRLNALEESLIRAASERTGGKLRAAARELGMSPATLSRRAKQLGVAFARVES